MKFGPMPVPENINPVLAFGLTAFFSVMVRKIENELSLKTSLGFNGWFSWIVFLKSFGPLSE
jgi:hypothetical protein